METKIKFSVDYKGNSHIIEVEDKSWIEKELIISADMDENGFGMAENMEAGVYSAIAIFKNGRGWLNGDHYEYDDYDLKDIQKIKID